MTSINVGEIDGTILYQYPAAGVVVRGDSKRFRVEFDSEESATAAAYDLTFARDGASLERFRTQNIVFVRVETYGIYSLEWHGTEIWRFEYSSQPG